MIDADKVARFFGRRGFNQHVAKYFLSNHQPAASRSLRMTYKGLLPNTETIVKNLNLTSMRFSGNDVKYRTARPKIEKTTAPTAILYDGGSASASDNTTNELRVLKLNAKTPPF
jgi:hypothetical protein